MKIFSTQLQGKFQSIMDQEEEFEDAARLAVQAVRGLGRLWIAGSPSAHSIALALAAQPDAPEGTTAIIPSPDTEALAEVDRLFLIIHPDEREDMLSFIQTCENSETPLIIYTQDDARINELLGPLNCHISAPSADPVIPDEKGERYGDPFALSAFFAGQLLYLYIKELSDELE